LQHRVHLREPPVIQHFVGAEFGGGRCRRRWRQVVVARVGRRRSRRRDLPPAAHSTRGLWPGSGCHRLVDGQAVVRWGACATKSQLPIPGRAEVRRRSRLYVNGRRAAGELFGDAVGEGVGPWGWPAAACPRVRLQGCPELGRRAGWWSGWGRRQLAGLAGWASRPVVRRSFWLAEVEAVRPEEMIRSVGFARLEVDDRKTTNLCDCLRRAGVMPETATSAACTFEPR